MGFIGSGSYNHIYYCAIRGKKEEYPFIKVQEKQGDKYVDLENEKGIQGQLKSIYFREAVIAGEKQLFIHVDIIDDPGILFKISANMESRMGRELANRLCNIGNFNFEQGGVRIKPFETEAGEGYEHGFKGVSVRVGGEVVKTKYSYNDLKDKSKKVEVKKGKFQYDNTELIEFLQRDLNSLLQEIGVRFPSDDAGAIQPESQVESQPESEGDPPNDPKQAEADAVAATITDPADLDGAGGDPAVDDEQDLLPF